MIYIASNSCLYLLDYDLWAKYRPQPVDIRTGDITDYYDVHEELGSGAFGVVHRITEKSSGRAFVAKFINTPYPADKVTRVISTLPLEPLHKTSSSISSSWNAIRTVDKRAKREFYNQFPIESMVVLDSK